jgi:hypothetical protein
LFLSVTFIPASFRTPSNHFQQVIPDHQDTFSPS